MIVSKPKVSTLFSLSMFLLITYAALFYTALALINADNKPWYLYLLVAILAPVALIVTAKVVLSFKIIRIGQGLIKVSYSLSFRKKEYQQQDLQSWQETVINTKSGVYKELRLNFPGKAKVTLSNHENESYEEILKHMNKRYPRQKVV
jgi:hypothetical protein